MKGGQCAELSDLDPRSTPHENCTYSNAKFSKVMSLRVHLKTPFGIAKDELKTRTWFAFEGARRTTSGESSAAQVDKTVSNCQSEWIAVSRDTNSPASRSVQAPVVGSFQSTEVGRSVPRSSHSSPIRMTTRACGSRSGNGRPARRQEE